MVNDRTQGLKFFLFFQCAYNGLEVGPCLNVECIFVVTNIDIIQIKRYSILQSSSINKINVCAVLQ